MSSQYIITDALPQTNNKPYVITAVTSAVFFILSVSLIIYYFAKNNAMILFLNIGSIGLTFTTLILYMAYLTRKILFKLKPDLPLDITLTAVSLVFVVFGLWLLFAKSHNCAANQRWDSLQKACVNKNCTNNTRYKYTGLKKMDPTYTGFAGKFATKQIGSTDSQLYIVTIDINFKQEIHSSFYLTSEISSEDDPSFYITGDIKTSKNAGRQIFTFYTDKEVTLPDTIVMKIFCGDETNEACVESLQQQLSDINVVFVCAGEKT
jgi:hypothetical protein